MPDPVTGWLLAWFAGRGMPADGCVDSNYFELGLIDSFGVVELIEAAEGAFSFRFRESDFQDRRFPTITGLTAIIHERMAMQEQT